MSTVFQTGGAVQVEPVSSRQSGNSAATQSALLVVRLLVSTNSRRGPLTSHAGIMPVEGIPARVELATPAGSGPFRVQGSPPRPPSRAAAEGKAGGRGVGRPRAAPLRGTRVDAAFLALADAFPSVKTRSLWISFGDHPLSLQRYRED